MIHFDRRPEPPLFKDQVRKPGRAWLQQHPAFDRPRDFWLQCRAELATAFADLCAYSCMYEPVGTVDHFISCRTCKARGTLELIYEWDNYRFASAWMNSAKQNADDQVFDPFEVQDGWFEVILPSLQLRLVEADIPADKLDLAKRTIERLHLEHDERVIRQRTSWYEQYQIGELTLDGLRRRAPLIARAVEKAQSRGTQ